MNTSRPPVEPAESVARRPGSPELTPAGRKALRAAAHHLDPVVMIGDAGLTDAVQNEIERALAAHQLIKIRVQGDDRDARQAIMDQVCEARGCAAVQIIGKLLVVWRPEAVVPAVQPKTDPKRKPKPAHKAAKAAAARAGAAKFSKGRNAEPARGRKPAGGKTASAGGKTGSAGGQRRERPDTGSAPAREASARPATAPFARPASPRPATAPSARPASPGPASTRTPFRAPAKTSFAAPSKAPARAPSSRSPEAPRPVSRSRGASPTSSPAPAPRRLAQGGPARPARGVTLLKKAKG